MISILNSNRSFGVNFGDSCKNCRNNDLNVGLKTDNCPALSPLQSDTVSFKGKLKSNRKIEKLINTITGVALGLGFMGLGKLIVDDLTKPTPMSPESQKAVENARKIHMKEKEAEIKEQALQKLRDTVKKAELPDKRLKVKTCNFDFVIVEPAGNITEREVLDSLSLPEMSVYVTTEPATSSIEYFTDSRGEQHGRQVWSEGNVKKVCIERRVFMEKFCPEYTVSQKAQVSTAAASKK